MFESKTAAPSAVGFAARPFARVDADEDARQSPAGDAGTGQQAHA